MRGSSQGDPQQGSVVSAATKLTGCMYLIASQPLLQCHDDFSAFALQASIESLTTKSIGTTKSEGLWGLDRVDQQSRKRDYMYHYSSTGAGVHVYTVDTVSCIYHQPCLHATTPAVPAKCDAVS